MQLWIWRTVTPVYQNQAHTHTHIMWDRQAPKILSYHCQYQSSPIKFYLENPTEIKQTRRTRVSNQCVVLLWEPSH